VLTESAKIWTLVAVAGVALILLVPNPVTPASHPPRFSEYEVHSNLPRSTPRLDAGGTYTVTFQESSSTGGLSWNVTLGGMKMSTTGTSVAFSGVADGSYPFTVQGPAGYNLCPSMGTIVVEGYALIQGIGVGGCPTGQIVFQTNTSDFVNWSLTFDGTTKHSDFANAIDFEGYLDGTYPYEMGYTPGWTLVPPSGTATVLKQGQGNFTFVNLTWTRVLYKLTFNETGLKANNQWGIGLSPPKPPTNVSGGGTENSTTSTITFHVSNGTFSFMVDGSGSYLATPLSGSIVVNGAPVNVSIKFVLPPPGEQWVTFLEDGLPSGTIWSLVLNGSQYNTAQVSITFVEPNGSYPVSIRPAAGLGPSPANLTVSVPGDSGPFTIDFLPVYPVTFTESDLTSGTNWSVSVTANSTESVLFHGGPLGTGSTTVTRWSDGASAIRFYLSNGTYSYTSSAPGQSGSSAPLSVDGAAPAPVGLTFHATLTSSNILGEPDWVFPVVGAIIVVAIAAVLLLWRKRKAGPYEPSSSSVKMTKSEGRPP